MTRYDKVYIYLACAFCTIVITGNLIFQKFISFNVPLFGRLELSVGVLLYPLTFLISDLLTEFYEKKKAQFVVKVTALCSIIVMLLLYITANLTAVSWSPVSDGVFIKVFNAFGLATLASIIANYLAQLADIFIFSWLKLKTRNKHLWLRNNVSTIVAQFIDTSCVLFILCSFNLLPWDKFYPVLTSSLIFKIFAALLDTPFCYLGHFLIKKYAVKKVSSN